MQFQDTNAKQTVVFERLPQTLSELQAMPEADFSSPFLTAALTVAVMCRYETSPQDCVEMMNYLRGPRPLSVYEQQFMRDRLGGKAYVPRSYFDGASPQNDYTPAKPYAVTVFADPYSYTNEGYARLNIRSAGADSPRQVMLRAAKGGTLWYLWENHLMPDIRIPASQDPWA